MKQLICLAGLALTACGGRVTLPPPEPVVRTVEVKVPVSVPCKALAELGAEPAEPDDDDRLRAAGNLLERVQLLLQGRVIRAARLAQYKAARASCE